MKLKATFFTAMVIAGATTIGAPATALAANARTPYANVDPRVDAGNDTGDSQVDRLNEAQLSGSAPGYQGNRPPAYQRRQYPGYAQVPPGTYGAQAYGQPRYAPNPYAPPPGYPPAPYGAPPGYPAPYPPY